MLKSKQCSIEGCKNPVWSKGLCQNHTGSKPLRKSKLVAKKESRFDEIDPEEIYNMHSFFQDMWDKMPKKKYCKSCGKEIFGECLTIYFHHVLPKAQYPEYKLDEKNILFVCLDCHTEIENGMANKEAKKLMNKIKKDLLNE